MLKKILRSKCLKCGNTLASSARYGIKTIGMSDDDQRRYFSAICFTETPIGEIHCLLDIANRQVNLEPYGLVFLKERLIERYDVSPVMYFNNLKRQADENIKALCTLISSHPKQAEKILPLVSTFGLMVTSPGAAQRQKSMDFYWEREWRQPSSYGDLRFRKMDVFIGLCPDDEVREFERLYPDVGFIDPRLNTKWYATKLTESLDRLSLPHSIV